MKIVCLLGSPRSDGNSSTIAKRFSAEAEKCGAEIEVFELNKLNFRGCQGCRACKKGSEICVLNDDLKIVLEKVATSDALVLSTPVYYGDVSSQLKAFIDRTYSYLTPDFITSENKTRIKKGKKLVFIIAQGYPDEEMYNDIAPKYCQFFKYSGFENDFEIRAVGVNKKTDATNDEDVMKTVVETARRVVKE